VAWKRSDWNAIIQQVNDLSHNPPEGCDALDPLPTVGPNHKWSRSDIYTLQERLLEMCDEDVFVGYHAKWAQSIITELNQAIDNEWCGCEPNQWEGPYEVEFAFDTTTYPGSTIVEEYEDFYCGGHWTATREIFPSTEWSFGPGEWQVGPPGITNRYARVQYTYAETHDRTETGQEDIHESWGGTATYYQTFSIDEDGWLRINSRHEVGSDGGQNYDIVHPTCEQYPVRHDDYHFHDAYTFSVSNVKLIIDRWE
jgi:hypothetical protein